MKIFISGCVIFIFSSSIILAQTTSPVPVDLSYHFKTGTVLHYQRLDENRKPGSLPGRAGGNYDIKEDIVIAVEKVDLDGSAMLVVQNEESDDQKGGDKDQVIKIGQVSVSFGQDIPMYSVKVDKYGRFLDGTILRRTPQDSIFHEKMKKPNFRGWGTEDSEKIKQSLYKNLIPRSPRSGVRPGAKWVDSTYEPSNPPHIPLNHSASSAVVVNPPGKSYKSRHYDYSLSQNTKNRKAGACELITETIYYQVFGGSLAGHAKTDSNEQFRESDGLPLLRIETGIGVDNSNNKTTFKLISIDSSAH